MFSLITFGLDKLHSFFCPNIVLHIRANMRFRRLRGITTKTAPAEGAIAPAHGYYLLNLC